MRAVVDGQLETRVKIGAVRLLTCPHLSLSVPMVIIPNNQVKRLWWADLAKIMAFNFIPDRVPLGQEIASITFSCSDAPVAHLDRHIYKHSKINQIPKKRRRGVSAFKQDDGTRCGFCNLFFQAIGSLFA